MLQYNSCCAASVNTRLFIYLNSFRVQFVLNTFHLSCKFLSLRRIKWHQIYEI